VQQGEAGPEIERAARRPQDGDPPPVRCALREGLDLVAGPVALQPALRHHEHRVPALRERGLQHALVVIARSDLLLVEPDLERRSPQDLRQSPSKHRIVLLAVADEYLVAHSHPSNTSR
jgi:hypothetical protein